MTLENCSIRDEVKSLKHSYDVSLDKLKEKQKLLDAAHAENQQLKIKVNAYSKPQSYYVDQPFLNHFNMKKPLKLTCRGGLCRGGVSLGDRAMEE